MKKINLTKIGTIIKVILQIFFIISILILIFLYPITKLLGMHFDLFIITIYPCGISFLCIVYQFIKMFNTLQTNNPFCNENIVSLKRNMVASVVISCLILIALLFTIFLYDYYTLQLKGALVFLIILFIGVSIAFYILSELFKQATIYKEENDLTI